MRIMVVVVRVMGETVDLFASVVGLVNSVLLGTKALVAEPSHIENFDGS
jgi:hypothetical protein